MKKKAAGPVRRPKPPRTAVVMTVVEEPVVHLLVRLSGTLDESSMPRMFQRAGKRVIAARQKRVLVDLRECKVALSISDLHGLVKMIASAFVGTVERLAVVPQARDILPEKFFEPALTSRGLPTLVTPDYPEGVYWLSSKLRPGR